MVLAPALTLSMLAGAVAAPPAEPAAGAVSSPDTVVTYQVRSWGGDPVELAAELQAAGYQVTGRAGDVLFVLGTASTAADLEARSGLTVVGAEGIDPDAGEGAPPGDQDPILPRRLHGNTYDTFYGGYRTQDAFLAFEDDLAEAYPRLVQVVEYGASYTDANPLRALCITARADLGCSPEPSTDKARFLLMAQIHARELTTSEMTWRLLTHLLDKNGRKAEVSALLDDTEIWVVPQTNPDGIEIVEDGIESQGLGSDSPAWQRKNANPGSVGCGGLWVFSQLGVDLNRNWDASWGGAGSSPQPCDLTYRGTAAASEPETSELADLIRDLFVDQRGSDPGDPAPTTTQGAMLTLHTYSDLVLFPYGSGADAPNDAGLRSMAFRMSYFNGYEAGRPNEILYEVTGSTDDWAYQDLGIAAFTYEIGPGSGTCSGFHPTYACQDGFWDLNRPGILYGAAAAQQPYTQGQGPTITERRARLKANGNVKIKGSADDDAYGADGVGQPAAQNVTAARLFVGTPPWDGGTPQPVTLLGSGTAVEFEASLEAAARRKVVYLQAKDQDGNWGPVAAVWRHALETAPRQ